jgi:hypothetical protein
MATWTSCWERAREPVDVAAAAAAACAAGASLAALLAPHAANVRLAFSPSAGRHLVAARSIPALTEVLLDPAVMWYPSSCDSMGATIPGMCEVRPGLSLGAVDGVLAQLAPFAAASRADAAAAAAGVPPPPPPPPATVPRHDLFIAACSLNALGALVDEDAPADRRRVPMVCAVAAMINHSCMPNCSYEGYYDTAAAAPGMRVYAEEDIAEGEEVSISYVPRHLPAAARREKLAVLYGFDCACGRCASGVEDTVVFSPALGGACIPAGASVPAPALALLRQRDEWLAQAAGRADLLTGTPPAPPPLLAPADQGRFSALYALLGALWPLDPRAHAGLRELQCAVGAGVCDAEGALGRRGRGRAYASDALLITGHYHALAGQREAAAGYYRRARAAFAALHGEGDFRCALAGELAAAPPATRAAAERAEAVKLARTRNWAVLYGVSEAALARWVRGAPGRSSGGAGAAASDAAAMRALLAASKAIMMQGGLLARVRG